MIAVTIVTICFNEEKNIARTIESVLNQTAIDFEYMICDGLSRDRTVSIAESYREKFAEKGISYRIFSEKDKGVYDAMNKGIDRANGRYIYFLNAGDWFCQEDVLGHFINVIREDSSPAVYYADYYYVDQHRASYIACDDTLLQKTMSIGHPAMVAQTELMRQSHFDLQYRIAADYNFVLGLKMQNLRFQHLDIAATYFMVGGISGVTEKANEELRRIHESYGLAHEDLVAVPVSRKQRLINAVIKASPTWLWRFYTERIKHEKWIEY